MRLAPELFRLLLRGDRPAHRRAVPAHRPGEAAQLVNEIDRKLQLDGARPILGWGKQYRVMWPHVKGYVAHENSIYNHSRMQNVWLDKK